MILRQTPSIHFARKSAPELFFAQPTRFVSLLEKHGDSFLEKLGERPDGEFARTGSDPVLRFSHRFQNEGDSLITVVRIQHGDRPWSSIESTAPVALAVALVQRSGQRGRCFSLESDPATRSQTLYESLPDGSSKLAWSGAIPDESSFLHHVGTLLQAPTPAPGAPSKEQKQESAAPTQRPPQTASSLRDLPSMRLKAVQPSGEFSAVSVLPILLIGLIASPIIAAIYRIVTYYSPLIYVNFIVTIIAGGAVGAILGRLFHRFQMRNQVVAVGLVAVLGLEFVAAAHFTSFHLWTDDIIAAAEEQLSADQLAAFKKDWSVLQFIDFFVETGWEVGRRSTGMPIQGIFVYLVWIVEAGVILGFAWTMTKSQLRSPYCEACRRWLPVAEENPPSRVQEFATHSVLTDAATKERVSESETVAQVLSGTKRRSQAPATDASMLDFKVTRCADHSQRAYIAVDARALDEKDKPGHPTKLVPWSHAKAEHYEALLALARRDR